MLTWKKIIEIEKKKIYFKKIIKFLKNQYINKNIFPKKKKIFQVFKKTEFKKIKIIIIGQDPYYKKNLADGLAFSTPPNMKTPASLINIYKEIKFEYPNYKIPKNGNLNHWAKKGILLLNSILTVEENKPLSHQNIGWEIFTNNIVKYINDHLNNKVFLLWGKYAQKKINIINKKKHLVLSSSHPSPYSYKKGFHKCNHFKKANKFFKKKNKKIIIW